MCVCDIKSFIEEKEGEKGYLLMVVCLKYSEIISSVKKDSLICR